MSNQPAYTYAAWLPDGPRSVHDGDTLHATIDLGLDIAVNVTIRFYGLNAPELATPAGKVAKQFVVDWFTKHALDGKFIIRTIKDRREKYGRYLGEILAIDGANLNAELVNSGNAVPFMVQ